MKFNDSDYLDYIILACLEKNQAKAQNTLW